MRWRSLRSMVHAQPGALVDDRQHHAAQVDHAFDEGRCLGHAGQHLGHAHDLLHAHDRHAELLGAEAEDDDLVVVAGQVLVSCSWPSPRIGLASPPSCALALRASRMACRPSRRSVAMIETRRLPSSRRQIDENSCRSRRAPGCRACDRPGCAARSAPPSPCRSPGRRGGRPAARRRRCGAARQLVSRGRPNSVRRLTSGSSRWRSEISPARGWRCWAALIAFGHLHDLLHVGDVERVLLVATVKLTRRSSSLAGSPSAGPSRGAVGRDTRRAADRRGGDLR
jgi:hypothetical protein